MFSSFSDIGCSFKDFSLKILVYYLRLWLKLMLIWRKRKLAATLLWRISSHGQVHPFGTFESNFQSDLLAGSIFFHLFIINSSSKFIWVVVHYCIVHIFPRRSIILWTKRRLGSRTRASCLLQSATRFITNCDRYFKVRWIYYKLRQVFNTKCDDFTNCDSVSDTLILVFVNEHCCLCICFTESVVFLLLIVSSLSCNFNRCAVCFQSFSEHRLQEPDSKCRALNHWIKTNINNVGV